MKTRWTMILVLSLFCILNGSTWAENVPPDGLNQTGSAVIQDDAARRAAIKGTGIKYKPDKINRSYIYYTQFTKTAALFDTADDGASTVNINFNMLYPETRRSINLTFMSSNIIRVGPALSMKINDVSWEITALPDKTYYYNYQKATAFFGIPDDLYEAIMKTNGGISLWFNYRSTKGYYARELILPAKFVKEVQRLYTICQ